MKTKSIAFLGTALVLAMTSSVVHAQTANQPPQLRISREGMQILCKRFPLNSRCTGNSSTNSGTQGQSQPTNTTPSSSGGKAQPIKPY